MGRLLLLLLFAQPDDDLTRARELAQRIARNPQDVEARIDYAELLLRFGMGDAARKQARQAVRLAPRSALAHRRLGEALAADSLGRYYQASSDLAGAVAEFRKAKALDPKSLLIRRALADVLEHLPGKLEEALAEYRALHRELVTGPQDVPLARVLLRAGKLGEALQLADAIGSSEGKSLAIAAAAAAGNRGEVKRRASDNAFLQQATRMLMEMRHYAGAALLLDELAAAGVYGPERAVLMRRFRHYDQRRFATDDPIGVTQKAFVDSIFGRDHRTLRYLGGWEAQMPPEVVADMAVYMPTFEKTGSDAVGWRVRTSIPFDGAPDVSFYVVREGRALRLVATSGEPWQLGLRARAALDQGDTANAWQWLDWAGEDRDEDEDDDPLSGRPFARIWPPEDRKVERDLVELATAALLAEGKATAAQAIPTLLKCAHGDRIDCDLALGVAYRVTGQPRERFAVGERLAGRYPDSLVAFRMRTSALAELGSAAQLRLLASQRLRAHPNDRDARAQFGYAMMVAGDFAGYERELLRQLEDGHGNSNQYNQIAWLSLFLRTANADDVAHARKAVELSHRRNRPLLNTLAAVLADTGKVAEARDVLVESLRVAGRDEPLAADFYVLGRIAEQVGLRAEAIAFYQKEPAPPAGIAPGMSAHVLAQRRLAALH